MKAQVSPIRQIQNNAANMIKSMQFTTMEWDEQNAAGRELCRHLLKDVLATNLPLLLARRLQQLADANAPAGVMAGFYDALANVAMRGAYAQ